MNKDMAIKCFRDQVMPTIKDEEKEKNESRPNYERRKQYWNEFMKIAHERGWINSEKYHRWTIPRFCKAVQNN